MCISSFDRLDQLRPGHRLMIYLVREAIDMQMFRSRSRHNYIKVAMRNCRRNFESPSAIKLYVHEKP